MRRLIYKKKDELVTQSQAQQQVKHQKRTGNLLSSVINLPAVLVNDTLGLVLIHPYTPMFT
jgi:hypothetical protein